MNKRYTDEEKLNHLSKVLWEHPVTPQEALSILKKEKESVNGFTLTNLYIRIINGFNWHTVCKIIPEQQLHEALSDTVIQGLFPRSLREKYRNARQLL